MLFEKKAFFRDQSWLSCFSISNTYDLTYRIFTKFAYANNLALLHSFGNIKDLEGNVSQDMTTLSTCLHIWRLKLSQTKTVMAVFHLNNQKAKHELNV